MEVLAAARIVVGAVIKSVPFLLVPAVQRQWSFAGISHETQAKSLKHNRKAVQHHLTPLHVTKRSCWQLGIVVAWRRAAAAGWVCKVRLNSYDTWAA